MILLIFILTAALGALFFRQCMSIKGLLPQAHPNLRGFVKFYIRGELDEALKPKFQIWFILLTLFSLSMWFFSSALIWNTNYNFLIGIFPFFWHFFFVRIFLWERHDLHEPGKNDDASGSGATS